MRNVLTIAGRELRSIFVSPIAYVVMTGFLLLGGWFFFNLLARFNLLVSMYSSFQGGAEAMQRLNVNEFVLAPLFHNLSVVLVILIPMITMRGFAEEKRAGTYELLLTSPVATWEIVLGKFVGMVAFISVMVALTSIYGLILWIYGNPEVGIMGVHQMQKRAVVLGDDDDRIVVRRRMNLSLSFDHRVIDGHEGAAFAQAVKAYLEDPGLMLLEMA